MPGYLSRRGFLRGAAGAAVVGGGAMRTARAADAGAPRGVISGTGSPPAEAVGREVFAAGGNAVDAIVAAALTAGVVSPHQCGIGGYGGHATIAMGDGRAVRCIDFNSTAPAAARHDMFVGRVGDGSHNHGWLAAGVPGTLAGLQLALDRFGTMGFADAAQPAIGFARDGFKMPVSAANLVKRRADHFRADPGSAELFFRDDQPPEPGARFTNPRLADMLQTLADRGRVDSFYGGDIGRRIADAFGRLGGIVTADDMAAYRALEVEPVTVSYRGYGMHTAPLTAGGVSTFQALKTLKALQWEEMPDGSARTRAQLEALRLVWNDRLSLLGDPDHEDVPLDRLLSDDYAASCAERVADAVRRNRPVATDVTPREQGGTVHLSAADVDGNYVALTLTHGNGFGAQVTVPGLGLILGHGVSRFDPSPNHPNSPGPGKRPLNNMVPTIVTRDGQPFVALGGRGGRRIPNAIYYALTRMAALDEPLAKAVAAPRMHTEGAMSLTMDNRWSKERVDDMKATGYKITRGGVAVIDAVGMDGQAGKLVAASR
ncbi:MAG: gamma-glutamyltransferase family protein [Planctomycetota bacterium]|jgi:gamma-glutamyltranspeptidase/glutathione hydrolase